MCMGEESTGRKMEYMGGKGKQLVNGVCKSANTLSKSSSKGQVWEAE